MKGQTVVSNDYANVHSNIIKLLEAARLAAVRSVNSLMTAIYWEVGRHIFEFEQNGEDRATYGKELIKHLAVDLTTRFGRGFSKRNLEQMRLFYQCWPIAQTPSAQSFVAPQGQMHLYLNYAHAHWTKPGENPPVGLILCATRGAAEAHYALENLQNKVLAAEYQTVLPNEKLLANELERSRHELETKKLIKNDMELNSVKEIV